MSEFSIQQGSVALCIWHLETGNATLHERAPKQGDLLVIPENKRVEFVLSPRRSGTIQRLRIGDVSLEDIVSNPADAEGKVYDGKRFWIEFTYFESARGKTKILLESRAEDSGNDDWASLLEADVYVLPSKIGEARYDSMAADLAELSRSLLVDLYGKSERSIDLRLAREGEMWQSTQHELAAIWKFVDTLGLLLPMIQQRPASRIAIERRTKNYWGTERIDRRSLTRLVRQGCNPHEARRPIPVITSQPVESYDIVEHRIIKAFICLLIHRAEYCLDVAQNHIKSILSEQPLRDVQVGEGPTLFELTDLPAIERLRLATIRADECIALASAMADIPILHYVRPAFSAVGGGSFQRSQEYELILSLIQSYFRSHIMWSEGDGPVSVTKLTSRLFEQWCFLQVVQAFRANGLDLREWDDALRQNLQSKFILDFDRGLKFEGVLGNGLRLRIRYEPWILGTQSASASGETLCRGSKGPAAWCPDVVIECLKEKAGEWEPIYGIVLDCKYTSHIREQHWVATSKYLEIRSTKTMRQVVRQLWLVLPGEKGNICSQDPAVRFEKDGPSCASDESIRFQLIASPSFVPTDSQGAMNQGSPFHRFAQGTMAYLRREFGSLETGDTPNSDYCG